LELRRLDRCVYRVCLDAFFVFVLLHTLFAGKRAAANPWGEGATTLEWQLPSPSPFHTYEELPVVV